MSSFMAKCEGCGYLIPKESNCPNCSHSSYLQTNSNSNSNSDGEAVNVTGEFAQRRVTHNRNSTIVMCIKMVVGFVGIMASGGAIFARMGKGVSRSYHRLESRTNDVEATSSGYEGLITVGLIIGILFVCAMIYHWFYENADSLLPTELCCPGCDERLDNLNVEYDKCPSCFVQLT